jgi:hypothetical protein
MMRRILPLLFALLLPSMAVAADEATTDETAEQPRASTDRAILLWGPSSAVGKDEVARKALEGRLALEEPFPSRILRISDWLGAARFRLGGSAVAIPCAAAPSDLVEPADGESEISALNKLGKSKLENLDFVSALEAFQNSDRRIPCQPGFLDRTSFWETYMYGGIASFYAGQNELSKEWFRQAASIAPEKEWDSSYPPEPQSTFLSAVQDVLARPKGRVFGDMRGTNYVEVRLDGEALDLGKAFELQVNPGLHVIQAVDDRGRWSTWVRKLDEGATLTFFSARGAESMMLEGPDGVLKVLAAAELTRRSTEERIDDVYLVTIDASQEKAEKVFAFSPEFQLWKRLEKLESGEIRATTEKVENDGSVTATRELTPEEKKQQTFMREADYRSSATFGFRWNLVMRCAAGTEDANGRCPDGWEKDHHYIGGLINIDVRLYKGLNLDIRFGATVSTGDFEKGGTVLPEFGAGFRYRFLTGAIQPFVAGGGIMHFGTVKLGRFDPPTVAIYGGIVGYGGVDFEFPDGFRLTLEGGGGVIIGGTEGDGLNWPVVSGMFALGRFLP